MSQTIKITDKIYARFKMFRDYCVANDVHNEINADTELLISHLLDRAITTREREIKFVNDAKQQKRAVNAYMAANNLVMRKKSDGTIEMVQVVQSETK